MSRITLFDCLLNVYFSGGKLKPPHNHLTKVFSIQGSNTFLGLGFLIIVISKMELSFSTKLL